MENLPIDRYMITRWWFQRLLDPHIDAHFFWVSNEQRAPGCLGDLLGMKFTTQLWGDYNKPL